MKMTSACIAVTGLVISLQSIGAAPAQDERIGWIREHAVPVRSVDIKDEDFSDLMPLVKAIGNARIVQLGEATHGDGTTFLAKSRLIRFLHEVMGFDVILWESGHYGCRLADAAMRSPVPGQSAAEAARLIGWSHNAENAGLFEYIRQTQATLRPMRMDGFDCRLGGSEIRGDRFPEYLIQFFDRMDPGLLSAKEREDIPKIVVEVDYGNYYADKRERDFTIEVFQKMLRYLDENMERARRLASPQEIAYLRQGLQTEIWFYYWCETVRKGRSDGTRPVAQKPSADRFIGTRDRIMGENIVWLANEIYPKQKIIVWAHNYHIMEAIYVHTTREQFKADKEKKLMNPMGAVPEVKLGPGQVYTIGFTGYQGAYRELGGERKPVPIAPAKEESLEWYLNQVDAPYSFLDFQGLPQDHWVREPHAARFYFWDDTTTLWPEVYDAMFFIRNMKPSEDAAWSQDK